jgi:uncharacterized metal-binding protein
VSDGFLAAGGTAIWLGILTSISPCPLTTNIAAVGAAIPEKVERTRGAASRVVIDGCADHCARKIMDKAGFQVDLHVDVTDLGIEKSPERPRMIDDAKRVIEHVGSLLDGQ